MKFNEAFHFIYGTRANKEPRAAGATPAPPPSQPATRAAETAAEGAHTYTLTHTHTHTHTRTQKVSGGVRDSLKEGHVKAWTGKPQHGYVPRKQQSQTDYDKQATNAWLNDRFMSSHVEGYLCAIQEQEIRTRQFIQQRENPETNAKCRYCNAMDESIFHILNSCRIHI